MPRSAKGLTINGEESTHNSTTKGPPLMLGINATLALCLAVPLIMVLTVGITLLGLKQTNFWMLGLVVAAIVLVIAIEQVTQPIWEKSNQLCMFGGTHAEYLACKEEQKKLGIDPHTRFYLLFVTTPTFLGVTLLGSIFWGRPKTKKKIP